MNKKDNKNKINKTTLGFNFEEMNGLINDSKLIIYNSYIGHIGSSQLNKIQDELAEFMSQF